jgi:methionine aminotransferase
MSQLAAEYNAINLSQGFPNFPVDERLTNIFAKLAKENVHQYTPMFIYHYYQNSEIKKLLRKNHSAETELLPLSYTSLPPTAANDDVSILAYDC